VAEEIGYLKLIPDVTAIRSTDAKPGRGYVIMPGDCFTSKGGHRRPRQFSLWRELVLDG